MQLQTIRVPPPTSRNSIDKRFNQQEHTGLRLENPDIPQLVAHRGDCGRFPENTRRAIEASLTSGACYVEFDVQLTRDVVPVVFHDTELERVAGRPGNLLQLDYEGLKNYSAAEPQRLGLRFKDEPIAALADIVQLLKQWPQVTAFVEIKRASIKHFGIEVTLSRLREVLAPVQSQCVLISFDDEILRHAKSYGFARIGWIFIDWQHESMAVAEQLQPQYLFTDIDAVPDEVNKLWQGNWQWVVYATSDPNVALHWASRGAALVETDNISDMLNSPLLPQAPCD
jgi:glycerophosphoryl diester phosphodiesterase